MSISYAGIDEASLIYALYLGTRAVGFGRLHDRNDLTIEDVRREMGDRIAPDDTINIDYYHGRPLKVSIDTKSKTFSPRLYDRDAGEGMARAVVEKLITKDKS